MNINPESKVGEVLDAIPGAKRALFAKYHIGGCSQCAYLPDETLGELCARNEDLPVLEVIAHLEESAAADARLLLEPASLAVALEQGDPPLVFDVRTREEFEHVRLEQAVLFTQEENQTVMGSGKTTEIVFVDHLGNGPALDAAAFLVGHGFEKVTAMRGGIDAYSREVDKTLKRYRLEIDPDETREPS